MKLTNAAAVALLVTFTFAILVLGKDLIIPMVLAVFIWYLINILAEGISRIQVRGLHLPHRLAFVFALFVTVGVLTLFANLISTSINDVLRTAPDYQENVENLLDRGAGWMGLDESPQLNQLIHEIDFTGMVQNLGFTLAGFLGSTGLILVYTLFIFLEQKCFLPKIDRMMENPHQREKVRLILRRIYDDTKTYIGIKTLTSLLTGVVSYVIMVAVDLDFALFWAMLIFLFNYIPTIGSIVATFFPSILALVQFPSLAPFLVVVLGVSGTQVLVGNILEPRLMGNTLNLSPLVILLSLALWGTLWGIPGAILCVPITVLLTIIFSNFEGTRAFAVMLSRDGEIQTDT
ncbi:MAG: AI-2E family transporter [Verrucomicrobia bacterium]|jgi:predicted PurR-regulated permease PerM|nr:AI-2E family transporter [Verrucomicrobiota bacterium]